MAIIVVSPAKRRTGTDESPVWHVPTDISGSFGIWATMDLVDLQDTEIVMDFSMHWSTDQVTWKRLMGIGWEGGKYLDMHGNPLPGPGLFLSDATLLRGKYVKLVVTVNKAVKIGLQIQTAG